MGGRVIMKRNASRRHAGGTGASAVRKLCAAIVAGALAGCLSVPVAAFADEATVGRADGPIQLITEDPSFGMAAPTVPEGAAFEAGSNASGVQALGIEDDTVAIGVGGVYHQTSARQMLGLVNSARASRGASPLVWDENLEYLAMVRAAEISVSFSHTRPNGLTCFSIADEYDVSAGWSMGENILMGASTPELANQLWTNSPGHYSNMVNTSFSSVGVAAFECGGSWYWVEFFGATRGTSVGDALDGPATTVFDVLPQYLGAVFSDFNAGDWYMTNSNNRRDLVYTLNNGIMSGYADRPLFGFYDNITRADVAVILYRMAGEPQADAPDFEDVDYGWYYGRAIEWARSTGVITGYRDADGAYRRFGPNDPVTREQLVVMLANFAEKIAGKDVGRSDAAASGISGWAQVSSWAREGMAWAVDEGILGGVSTSHGPELQPQGNATRAQVAIMAARLHRDVLGW